MAHHMMCLRSNCINVFSPFAQQQIKFVIYYKNAHNNVCKSTDNAKRPQARGKSPFACGCSQVRIRYLVKPTEFGSSLLTLKRNRLNHKLLSDPNSIHSVQKYLNLGKE